MSGKKFIFLTLFAPLVLLGQELTTGYSWIKNVNKASDHEFGRTDPYGIDLSWSKRKTGALKWEEVYNKPKLGWHFTFIDHKNKFLGQSYVFSRYMEVTLTKLKNIELNIDASHGLMYATKVYNAADRPSGIYNNAISQNLNFSASLGLGFYFRINRSFSFGVRSSLSHFSNGAMSQPNDGLNLWSLTGRLAYYYAAKKTADEKINPEQRAYEKSLKVNASFGAGMCQVNSENKTKYPLYTTMLYLDKQVSEVSKIGFGFDLYVNTGTKHSVDDDPFYKGADYKRAGFSVGHELMIHKLGLLTYFGYHFYSPYPGKMFYQKYGVKYFFTKNVFAVANLKINNFEISDELSWGLGIRL